MSDNIEWIIELEDWPDYYASTFGYIYSNKKGKLKKLKGRKNRDGYLLVALYKNDVRKDITIHRLICKTFKKPKKKDETEVHHINENKEDNNINNLTWINRRNNIIFKKPQKSNKSGIVGVHYCNTWNNWVARISNEKNKRIRKNFKTKEDAISWRKEMEKKYYKY